MKMVKKICQELVAIRKELQAIRNSLESKKENYLPLSNSHTAE